MSSLRAFGRAGGSLLAPHLPAADIALLRFSILMPDPPHQTPDCIEYLEQMFSFFKSDPQREHFRLTMRRSEHRATSCEV
jgi:hypothetical protein